MALSHTAKYASGIETISTAAFAPYLRARSAVFHADRSTGGSQIYWSPPQRRWLKLYTTAPGVITIESHSVCPCSIVGG